MAFAKLNSMKFVGLDGLSHFWSKAKTWIIDRITTEVTAKIAEIVANAPEDLDTLKEISDWISSHADDASAMNTQITANTSDIATLKTTVAGKSDTGHTHTKSQITDFPSSLPANGGNADTVGNYNSSSLWRSDGANWDPNSNVIMTPNGNDQEWSFDFRNKNGAVGSYWHVWDENKNTLLKVDADSGQVSAPYGFVGDLTGTATNATNATNDSNGKNIANTYMPKSGGTFSGNTYFNSDIHCNYFYPKDDISSSFWFYKDTDSNSYLPMILSYNCGSVFNNNMCLKYYTLNCSNKNEALKNLNELKKLFASMYPHDSSDYASCVSIHGSLYVSYNDSTPTFSTSYITNYGYCSSNGDAYVRKDGSIYVDPDFECYYHILYTSDEEVLTRTYNAYILAEEILVKNLSRVNGFACRLHYVLAEHL